MNRKSILAAPCGIYCGACPSYLKAKSCYGCRSEAKQKRTSKYGCRIRQCCLGDKGLSFCYECEEFPCQKLRTKLPESHPGDKRFAYRHEVIANLLKVKDVGLEIWLEEQATKWRCPECGGHGCFYSYECCDCGVEVG